MSKKIKLVVWDLDNTLWKGTLTEDENVTISDEMLHIIKTLDQRGILQSIASKNDFNVALERLKLAGIEDMFLYPQINWNPKSENIRYIIKKINIADEAVAFVDDQDFELKEVKYHIPDICCINSKEIDSILDRDNMIPEYITNDSCMRRILYMNDQKRDEKEKEFVGTSEEFLQTLGMVLQLSPAKEEDLMRCAELTVRTHQLNSTGYTYTFDELRNMIEDDRYIFMIAGLKDNYGEYGKIGLILIQKLDDKKWILKLLLTSCRVMSRGIGGAVLKLIINHAINNGINLFAEFVPTDRNRIMAITYATLGFHIYDTIDGVQILRCERTQRFELPDYLQIIKETDEF